MPKETGWKQLWDVVTPNDTQIVVEARISSEITKPPWNGEPLVGIMAHTYPPGRGPGSRRRTDTLTIPLRVLREFLAEYDRET